MGFEYRFRLSRRDLDNLAKNPHGASTLEQVLRGAPGFARQEGNVFFFDDATAEREDWPTTAAIDDRGFVLCIYDRRPASRDLALMSHLIHELLDRCGHVEVEDA